ncbi:hypothetical protein BV898_02734 [Hypsibius exemplaris]|uniref:Uncharacterized protein n=1 Tax=Hypsibius exemplaris TaxID=2072580 RepID=A0A1W0X798_HYPEX|nr:hypothetical protein BV898_02734 [Hypsibius exemplaris]
MVKLNRNTALNWRSSTWTTDPTTPAMWDLLTVISLGMRTTSIILNSLMLLQLILHSSLRIPFNICIIYAQLWR